MGFVSDAMRKIVSRRIGRSPPNSIAPIASTRTSSPRATSVTSPGRSPFATRASMARCRASSPAWDRVDVVIAAASELYGTQMNEHSFTNGAGPRVTLTAAAASEVEADVLAVPVASGASPDPGIAALGESVAEFVASGAHRGRLHDVMLIPAAGGTAVRRVLLYGLGAERDLDGQRLHLAHQEMVQRARAYGCRRIAVLRAGPLRADHAGAIVEG